MAPPKLNKNFSEIEALCVIELDQLIQQRESTTLEFKKSTALLPKIGETLCGFLNGKGGKVLIGISDEGKVIGQHVSDHTLREIAEILKKFEPPPLIEIDLRRHLPISGKILPGVLERHDEPLFPLVSLREALVNALCHRTYSCPGGAVSIAIFDDRLEIWNDGTLPFGLTPADLKVDHASHQRNPLIASIFYNRGLIEKWGRGTQKIVSLCVKAGHPEPGFFEQANSFVVRFLPSGYIAPHRISLNLTDRQRQILQALSFCHSEGITFTNVKTTLQNPPADRTLRDDFQHLKRLGLVDVNGHGRGAKWALTPFNENKAE